MAEGKKGFILYADQKEIFDQLTDIKAGQLIKHIFKYVNDEDPKTKDAMINLAFTPIKLQLKRDLKKWGVLKSDRSKAGSLGNLKRYNPDLYDKVVNESISLNEAQRIAKDRKGSQSDTKLAVTVNDNVNVKVNDTVTVNDKERVINIRRAFIENVIEQSKELSFGEDIYNPFCEYWTEKDFESGLMQFQTKENFGIKSRLKRWNELSSSENENWKQELEEFKL